MVYSGMDGMVRWYLIFSIDSLSALHENINQFPPSSSVELRYIVPWNFNKICNPTYKLLFS